MKRIRILLCLFIGLCLSACSSNSSSNDAASQETISDTSYNSFSTGEYNYDKTANDGTENSDLSKIIYTVSINYETKDFDKSLEVLNEKINEYNGYIVNRYIYTYDVDNGYIDGQYTIRIPASSYRDFLNDKDAIASVTSLNESANDITSEYIDLSARLENLKLEEKTIQGLLDKANEIADILEIETKLSEVRGDIESYESRIKYYDTLTDYATIDIYISQVKKYTANKSFIEKLGDTFKDSFNSFKNALSGLLDILIYALPYLLIALVLFFIIRKIRNKQKALKKPNDNLSNK